MKTIKQFTDQSHIDPLLIRAVIRQCGGWDEFKSLADDVTNHGADCGFSGFIYYKETLSFYKRHKVKILNCCKDLDSQIENVGLLKFIAGFNCLKCETEDDIARAIYQGRGDSVTAVQNALAWFALEEVCRSYSDLTCEG